MWSLQEPESDSWVEVSEENKDATTFKVDMFDGEEDIEDSNADKYIGDIVSSDGWNMHKSQGE